MFLLWAKKELNSYRKIKNMGYGIYIGEAVLEKEKYSGMYIARVHEKCLPVAPSFTGDPLSDHKNGRHPSYHGWHEFVKKVGLNDFFFDEDCGLMSAHPGCFILKPEHLSKIQETKTNWIARHPNAVPGFMDTKFDDVLARLIWLEFWIDWSLKNCKNPAIFNI